MHQQAKNIKGFNILELIVVITIISVLSAAAYPNFSHWRKERATRSAAIEIKSLIENIYAQTQRGYYGFVQVQFKRSMPAGNLIAISRGMKKDKLLLKVRSTSSTWWNEEQRLRCRMDDDTGFSIDPDSPDPDNPNSYWSDDGSVNVDGDANNDIPQVNIREYDKITLDIINSSAICFSSDGSWYQGNGDLEDGGTTSTVLYICPRTNAINNCLVTVRGDILTPDARHDYIFEVSWSRFGNVELRKWNHKKSIWALQ